MNRFTKGIVNKVTGRYKEEGVRRENICKECYYYIKITRTCSMCGCFIKIKTRVIEENCPINKW